VVEDSSTPALQPQETRGHRELTLSLRAESEWILADCSMPEKWRMGMQING